MLVHLQKGRHIPAAVAVVGSRPDCHQFLRENFLVALHYQLVGPANEGYVVGSVELLNAGLPEEIAGSSGGDRPALDLVGVRPHQVAHGSSVGNLLFPVNCLYIIDVGCAGRQPSVNAKYFIVNQSCKGKVVEYLCAILPHVQGAVFPQALVIESVDLSYLPRLMISPQQSYPRFISNFERKQKDESLYTVESPVHEVAHEEVGDVGSVSSYLEEFVLAFTFFSDLR